MSRESRERSRRLLRGDGSGIFRNLPLKGFSLLLALGLWAVVPDPNVLHIVPGVPVQMENLPTDLALSEAVTPSVDVHVRGAALRTRDLTPGELSPSIDLFGLFPGDNTILLSPDMIAAPFGVTVERIEPSQITLTLEERVRRELPVSVVVEGDPAADYEIYDRIVQPGMVTVSGPASHVEQLESIPTEKISVAGRRETLTRSVRVIPEDPTLRLEGITDVQVTVEIDERPVNFQLQGIEVTVANATSRVVVNPAVIGVVVQGPPSVVNALTPENFVATIDVDGLAARNEDYRIEPTIAMQPPDLAERIQVIALTPQRRLDVHIYPE